MKTSKNYIRIGILGIIISAVSYNASAQNQVKPTIAVLGIDSKDMDYDGESVSYMVRLELEKTNVCNVMDKYDVTEILKVNNMDPSDCLGTTCVIAAGKVLKADKMISGYVERFGDKIAISLKLIDVKTESVEKQDATEYLNLQIELQKMIAISVQKLMCIAPDKDIVSVLVNYDAPVKSPRTKASYSGPRMGVTMMFGDAAKRYTAPNSEGGFNMYPVMFQFGWQQEIQYLSSGNFSALIEIIPMIGGLESGRLVPSLTLMNGFRMGKGGWEIAFGPSFRITQMAQGFYTVDTLGVTKWHLASDAAFYNTAAYPYISPLMNNLDYRGKPKLSGSLMISFGRTFKSGYLNIPVNIYASFRKEGTIVGVSCGFNVTKQPKKAKNKKN